MPQDHHRQLGNFFINRALQFRLVFISLGYMAVMLLVTLAFTLLPVLHTMFESSDPTAQYQSAQTFLVLAQRLVPAVLFLFVLFFIHLVVMTHRICGPMVNFTHTFEAMAEGDFTRRVHLRKNDYLHEEAEILNETLDTLHHHLTAIQEENRALTESLEKTDPTPRTLAEVRTQSEKLSDLVDAFHL